MVVSSKGSGLEIRAPAKLNLHLELLARRADGYHELETVMVPLSLSDTLQFQTTADGEVQLECRWAEGIDERWGSAWGTLPATRDNLVWRALELLRGEAGVSQGARVRVIKRVPAQAGLGGASSNAAAALVAGNRGWNVGYTREQLAELGAKLGSDVPFFLNRGAALARGRGEKIESLGLTPPLPVVVVRPNAGLSTPAVYRACRVPERPKTCDDMVEAVRRGDARNVARQLVNRLAAPAEELLPVLKNIRKEFERAGCLGSQLSGSGSCYFGIFRQARQANHAAARLRANGSLWVYAGLAGGFA